MSRSILADLSVVRASDAYRWVVRHTDLCVAAGYLTPEEKTQAVNLFRERFGRPHPVEIFGGAA